METAMSPFSRPDPDDLPPPRGEEQPGLAVWAIAGGALILAYVLALALLRPAP
jgi:hypothetical protein